MKQVRVVLVGIGGYGDNYIRDLIERHGDDVFIEGICDPMASASSLYIRIVENSIPIYTDIEEFYRFHAADLAVISSPIHTHYSYMMACLSHGSHILCEKPPCVNMDEMEELVEAEARSGSFIAVGYQLCFSRDVWALKQDILDGKFGRALTMNGLHLLRRGETYYQRNNWAGKKYIHGCKVYDSPVSNACAHQLQTMLFLLGADMESTARISSVDSLLCRANPLVENFDTAAVHCFLENGTKILYCTSHAVPQPKTGPLAHYAFEKADIYFGKDGNPDFTVEYKDGRTESYADIPKGKRLQKLEDCLDAVRTGKRPYCTIRTAVEHVRCINMVQQSGIRQMTDEEVSVRKEGTDIYYCILDLTEKFTQSYEKGVMPHI